MPKPAPDIIDKVGDLIEHFLTVFVIKAHKTYTKKLPKIEAAINRAHAKLDKVT